jgi:type I restriction enzyme S subunit
MAASDWTQLRLGEVCTKIGSGATPRGGADVYLKDGRYSLIRSQNIYNDGFRRDGLVFLSEEHAAELSNVEVVEGDVLLNITGDSVARACQVDPGVLPARVNQHVAILRPDPHALAPRFLRYALVAPEMQARLLSWAGSGGTRNALTKEMIASLEVVAPKEVAEQEAIASILGTLDDKIRTNHRLNETLEEIVKTMFESWFVDFHPVRAKAGKRDTGLATAVADIFPDRLIDSELGEIPEGWSLGTFGTVAEHRRRGVQPDQINPETPYIALEHMPRRSITLADWGVAAGLQSNKFEFRRGELLFGKLRPYFHKVGVAPLDGVCSTDIVVIAPKTDSLFGFVLGHVSSDAFVTYATAGSMGTKMPRTDWIEMARYPIALPPMTLCDAFTRQVRPMVDRIIAGIHESRTLSVIRNSLVPKLTSGEVRVING